MISLGMRTWYNRPMQGKKRTEGFTLIETLVVMAIIAILSGMTIAYTRSSGQRIVLFTDQAAVMNVLNRAKSLALERYKQGSASFCAFGVAFDAAAGTYTIVGVPAPASGNCPMAGPYTTLEGYMLDRRVVFSSLPSASPILFTAPYLTAVNFGTVTLQMPGTSPLAEAKIEITQGGSISAIP